MNFDYVGTYILLNAEPMNDISFIGSAFNNYMSTADSLLV